MKMPKLIARAVVASTYCLSIAATPSYAQVSPLSAIQGCHANFKTNGSPLSGYTFSTTQDFLQANADAVYRTLARAIADDHLTIVSDSPSARSMTASNPVANNPEKASPVTMNVHEVARGSSAALTFQTEPFLIVHKSDVEGMFCKWLGSVSGSAVSSSTVPSSTVPSSTVSRTSGASTGATIRDCESATAWFGHESGSKVTLGSGGRTNSKPARPDSLNVDFKGAAYYRGHVGGGGCLGGYYDGLHRIAAMTSRYDTYDDAVVFAVRVVPNGLSAKDLGAVQTARGVRLGMSIAQVERIEGTAKLARSKEGDPVLHYTWTQPMKGYGNTPVTYDLTFLFKGGRLAAMDYGYGV